MKYNTIQHTILSKNNQLLKFMSLHYILLHNYVQVSIPM